MEENSYPTIGQSVNLALRFILYSVGAGLIIGIIISASHNKNTTVHSFYNLLGYLIPALTTIWVGFNKVLRNGEPPLKLKFNPVPILPVIVSVLVIMTMPILMEPLDVLLPMPDNVKKMFEEMSQTDVFSLFTVIIAAPVLEEILFRGILLNGLLKNYPPQTAILTTAAIFAIVHLNPWQAIPAFLGALIMGWMYWKTNSIIPGMILHFANNLFTTILAVELKKYDSFSQVLGIKGYYLLYAVCFAVMISGWLFLEKAFEDRPYDDARTSWLKP